MFDLDPVAPERRERDGVVERWEPDPDDRMFGGRWVAVDGQPEGRPNHKAPVDPLYAYIKKHEYEFRKRTMQMIEAEGGKPFKVDSYNHMAQRSSDLWGLFDTCAIMPDGSILFANQTSKSHLGEHVTKMLSALPVSKKDRSKRRDHLAAVLRLGAQVRLYGFYKEGARWQCEVREITQETLARKKP